jgi:histidinol dehydrogenase
VDKVVGPAAKTIATSPWTATLAAVTHSFPGPTSPAVLVTPVADVATAVADEIDRQLASHDRAEIIRDALGSDESGLFVADSMADAIAFAEEYAAEHLSIQAAADEAILERIDSAGSVFLGPYTPVAAGDYVSGPNHVLPTNRGARVTGGLAVETFLRASTVQRLDEAALADLGETITILARAEGLDAHAESVERRLEE